MKITVLTENSTPSDRICARHGLSLFLETGEHHVLFDMGPDAAFLDNARALGVDVRTADVTVLSHGHFDHSGGLAAYLEATEKLPSPAPVYVSQHAFEEHVAKTPVGMKDIGADARLASSPRLRFVGRELHIDDELTLFSEVEPAELAPRSNATLMERDDNGYAPDRFVHEQSLLVNEGDKRILISGCSHCGIVNIMRRAEELAGGPLDAVVAGFHLMDPGSGTVEDPNTTRQIARFMAGRPTRYFTFHCTGMEAYSLLRDELGERVRYLNAGARVELD